MVTCPKCGTRNEDDAKFCASCGTALYPERTARRDDECFGQRQRGPEDECFGLPHGGAIAGILVGFFIVILGISVLFERDIGRWIGPFVLITIGILIVVGVLLGRNRYRS